MIVGEFTFKSEEEWKEAILYTTSASNPIKGSIIGGLEEVYSSADGKLFT